MADNPAQGDLPAHEMTKTIEEVIEYPAHEPRETSPEFRHNRHILLDRLGLGCRCCETKADLEVHHLIEWAEWESVDPAKVLTALRQIDFYGFGHHKGDEPIRSPDDIRNLVVLCRRHHRLRGTGIHNTTFPPWLAQMVANDGSTVLEPEK